VVKAEYDSEARAMFITLVDEEWVAAPVADITEFVFVHRDITGRPVGIEIIEVPRVSDADVVVAANRCAVCPEHVLACRDAALRAPDCAVTLTFAGAIAA